MKKDEEDLGEVSHIPSHVAIIPDGNRGWARAHHMPTLLGHKKGIEAALSAARACRDWGVKVVSLWGFSTENWERPEQEVGYLMRAFESTLKANLKELASQGARLHILGRRDRLPAGLRKMIEKAEEETIKATHYILNIGLDYGGRNEILRAVKKLIEKGLSAKEIDEKNFAQVLDTAGMPDPDLLIRTSGEMRTSGLMPWQTAYTELYFEPVYFPDFTPKHLKRAFLEYSRRQRRYGR